MHQSPHQSRSAARLRLEEIDFRKLGLLILALVLVAGLAFGGYSFVRDYVALREFKEDRDVEKLKKRLSTHFILPKEEPIIATVTDVEKLKKEQPFYRNAKNGDKVFIWKDKALIYRMNDDRIVDFGIIVNKPGAGADSGAASQESPATVRILNGSTESGVAATTQADLTQALSGQNITFLTGNASRTNYSGVTVAATSPEHAELAASIAAALNTEVAPQIPAGESVEPGDAVLVIVGGVRAGQNSPAVPVRTP